MKLTTLLNRSAIATALLSASLTAFAGGGGGPRGPAYPYSSGAPNVERHSANTASSAAVLANDTAVAGGDAASGKSRSLVQAELLKAREAGWLPTSNAYYPPARK